MACTRRSMLKVATSAACVVAARPVLAQQYPARTVKIIVPAGAGTGIDAVTRFFAEHLGKRLGQAFVTDNRPGAGGLLGYTGLTKSAPDGYTLILTGIPLYLLPLMSEAPQPPFDSQKDFAPVARVARIPLAIVVEPDSPHKTMKDLLQAMAKNPGDVTYSSQGVGSTAHLCAVVLNDMSRTKGRHIPYKESAMATTDVVAGRIGFTCQSSAAVIPLIQSGKLRALGVTNARRWKALPDVPTVAEAGVPGFDVSSQLDFMAPVGTPEPILKLLSEEIERIVKSPQYEEFCDKQALAPESMNYKTLVPEVAREVERWKRIVALARG